MIAKNNILIRGADSIAFSIYRSKNKAVIDYYFDYKFDKEVMVDLTQVEKYWNRAFKEGYEVGF
jgi:hypothetical protein